MFCPKCATQNVDGASFCRSCGANISLVPQALTGQLSAPEPDENKYYGRRRRRGPSTDYAVRSLMMGVAFSVMAVLVFKFAPGASHWWFWLLLPAMMWIGRGFSELVRLRSRDEPRIAERMGNAVRTPEVRAAQTGELMTPVHSVTEGTTRHLGTEAQTRPIEFVEPRRSS